MTGVEEPREVQIDNRLSDLFQSRRNRTEEEQDETAVSPEPDNQGFSWLEQFKVANDQEVAQAEKDAISARATFKVKKSECNPFWAPADSKRTNSIWKKSKPILAKDCMKQRKAALRKTVKR